MHPDPEPARIPLAIPEPHACALAQLVKRIDWHAIRDCAVDDAEARLMRDALLDLQAALARSGFNPR